MGIAEIRARQESSQEPRQRPGSGAILTLANGVLAGVASVYVSTRSFPVTVIAAVLTVVLAAMVLIVRR